MDTEAAKNADKNIYSTKQTRKSDLLFLWQDKCLITWVFLNLNLRQFYPDVISNVIAYFL